MSEEEVMAMIENAITAERERVIAALQNAAWQNRKYDHFVMAITRELRDD